MKLLIKVHRINALIILHFSIFLFRLLIFYIGNPEQLNAYDKLKEAQALEGKAVTSDEIVRPRVPLDACLRCFSSPEEVHDFDSTALQSKTAGLTTFPKYLVLHMRKVVIEEGWMPQKFGVYIDVPDVIDISHMRSKGL